MDKTAIFILLLLLSQNTIKAQDKFLGFWSNEDKTQIVKIYKVNKDYEGELIYRKDIPLSKIEKKVVLQKMKKKDKRTMLGKYFDYSSKNEYEVKLALKDVNTIFFIGYKEDLTIGMIWHRVP